MGKVAYDLLSNDHSVAFATPTGKAAQVLKKSMQDSGVLEAPVSTIHSLIYIPEEDPKTGRVIGWQRRRFLDVDLIIIDEASMVSQKMLEDLRRFGKPILAVGDHGQLPPVGEEASLMKNPDFRLEKIHRQAKGSPIIRLSTLVRNGCPDHLIKKFIEEADDERVMWTRMKDAGKEFGQPPGMLLCYTNKLRTALNNDIRHEIMGYDEEYDPQPGEVVICLKNKRLDDDGRMIANGMRGTIVSCGEGGQHSYKMTVEFDEPVGVVEDIYVSKWQFLREKTFKGFDEVPGDHQSWWSVGALFDYGYALTCHKAQGSQSSQVAVFMESWLLKKLDDEDRRRWIYTAVTRAADKVMLVF
jgi:ATP-dependent exoDNAse (exonuclease V) alpha subunit